MAGESQQPPKAEPDPSDQTTARLEWGLQAERDYVDGKVEVIEERLRSIDRATVLLNETVNRVPTDVQTAVANLKELHDEKFGSVQQQFAERDTRSERESRDNKVAVDAAFAAQKEAASEQNKSNTLAIDKSERATAEKQDKFADLFKSKTDSLDGQISDLKERLTMVETARNGESHGRDQQRMDYGLLVSIAGVAISIIAVVVVVLLANPR